LVNAGFPGFGSDLTIRGKRGGTRVKINSNPTNHFTRGRGPQWWPGKITVLGGGEKYRVGSCRDELSRPALIRSKRGLLTVASKGEGTVMGLRKEHLTGRG